MSKQSENSYDAHL